MSASCLPLACCSPITLSFSSTKKFLTVSWFSGCIRHNFLLVFFFLVCFLQKEGWMIVCLQNKVLSPATTSSDDRNPMDYQRCLIIWIVLRTCICLALASGLVFWSSQVGMCCKDVNIYQTKGPHRPMSCFQVQSAPDQWAVKSRRRI